MLMFLSIALLLLIDSVNSFTSTTYLSSFTSSFTSSSSSSLSMALKFDPSKFIKVKVKKPLGISLEEVEENTNRGVMVTEVKKDSNSRYYIVLLLSLLPLLLSLSLEVRLMLVYS